VPPTGWLRAVFALRTRPTPYAPTIRGTLISPSSASTRASTKIAPNECIRVALLLVARLRGCARFDVASAVFAIAPR
jgi:hypothetical protein